MEKTHQNDGLAILQEAQAHYQRLDGFRKERDRNKRYNYGDQWGDMIEVDGRLITEDRYIKEQGSIPLKNNLIRRLVRNVVGIYQSQANHPICVARDSSERHLGQTMNRLLEYCMQVNRMKSLYTRSMEEFLISGMIVHKKSFGVRNGRLDCWTDYIQPNNFFIDTSMCDFRGWDCKLVGEIHHIRFSDVCRQFASSEDDCRRLSRLFAASGDDSICQVTEVWRREARRYYSCHDTASGRIYRVEEDGIGEVEQENKRRADQGIAQIKTRWRIEDVWRYYFISPTGSVLSEGDTPYAHGSHPYVVKLYPMIDGEIHSFVGDVVDQQRYTNRLITLYDWIMRSSAKGVLMVPEDCLPRGCSPDEFADAWSRYNGVIFYHPSATGETPRQVVSNSTNIGIRELLDVQLNFFEDISGVSHALQGKSSNVGMSAELYGQQTQNATTTLLDVLDTFNEFVREAAYKDMKNIQQFYTDCRIRQIVGDGASLVDIQDIEFDLNVEPSTNTPAIRQTSNAMLMEIWKSGQISLEQMLKAGDFPFAEALRSL